MANWKNRDISVFLQSLSVPFHLAFIYCTNILINCMGFTRRSRTAYPSWASDFTLDFLGLWLWYLTPLLCTWRKPLTCRKLYKLYHVMLYRVHLAMSGNQTLNFRVTDCIGNFKSNHPTTLFLNMSKNSVFVHNNNCFIFVSLLLFPHVSSLCIDLRLFKSCLGISSAFNVYY